jgi:hypothetical protein
MDLLAVTLTISFFAAIGVITGLLAARKGYWFLPWMFAGGIIGLIVLAFLPFANSPELSDVERVDRMEKGNDIGRKLAAITVVIGLIRLMAAG